MAHLDIQEIISRCDEFFNAGNTAGAGEFLREKLSLARQLQNQSAELTILNELIGHYRMMSDPDRGINAINDAACLLGNKEFDGIAAVGTIYLNIATALHSFNRNDEALKYYDMAHKEYRKQFPPEDISFAGLYNNMAAFHNSSGEFTAAENYYLAALDILQKHNNRCDAAVTCVNLAGLYAKKEDFPLVETFLDCAMDFLSDPELPHNGYFAHSCLKCAPVFGEFDRKNDMEKLTSFAGEVYERN